MKTTLKYIGVLVLMFMVISMMLQANAKHSTTAKFDVPVGGTTCRFTDIEYDVCIKAPNNLQGCVNTLDSTITSCTTPPPIQP
ncbi:hypothetical protein D9M68_629630 [compost metagenome]